MRFSATLQSLRRRISSNVITHAIHADVIARGSEHDGRKTLSGKNRSRIQTRVPVPREKRQITVHLISRLLLFAGLRNVTLPLRDCRAPAANDRNNEHDSHRTK